MLRLEPRAQTSPLWRYASPLLALAITVVLGTLLFAALGKDPVRGLTVFFWEPIKSAYAWSELLVKATPTTTTYGAAPSYRLSAQYLAADGATIRTLTPTGNGRVTVSDGVVPDAEKTCSAAQIF